MATKIDIMNRIDGGNKWQIIGGKIKRIEETIPTGLVLEKEEVKEVDNVIKELIEIRKEIRKPAQKGGKKK